jgi:lipoprotein-releasing system permease protein
LRSVFTSLKAAQNLLDLSDGVSSILLHVDDIFTANDIADAATARTGLVADSWMEQNGDLLVALQSQSSSSSMIQFFVVLAVALGIASVLFVSVVQKSKEIGILKAIGTRTEKVTRIFVIQGLLVGLIGSAIGCVLGAALALGFEGAALKPDGTPTIPIALPPVLFLRSSFIAILSGIFAAVAPARRAARLDPATVIRNG